ncbi:divergent PAP2 family protein [uncultured Vibrio sp.]|uniref:divergent PAP2 family protein n=1 Tax=uncultured Vibrio sp. TaxID=114054 RepID=UPI00091AD9F4|nr:divergent PAP2 family protein [uncultured Vibrio sp.]OIQ25328.1 MAG: acid phosphatase [Vibrio sp. MedPE-SWchi]
MDLSYLLTPLFAWIIAGSLKFIINSIKAKRLAFDLIGYGGMPSNHSSIVTSAVTIIALKEGIDEPALVAAVALAFVVILDANSLRQQIGKHAKQINSINIGSDIPTLRERIGHTRAEIAAGVVSGISSAALVYFLTI